MSDTTTSRPSGFLVVPLLLVVGVLFLGSALFSGLHPNEPSRTALVILASDCFLLSGLLVAALTASAGGIQAFDRLKPPSGRRIISRLTIVACGSVVIVGGLQTPLTLAVVFLVALLGVFGRTVWRLHAAL